MVHAVSVSGSQSDLQLRCRAFIQVYTDSIYVLAAEVGGVRWQDVLVLPACRVPSAPISSFAVCAVRVETQGWSLLVRNQCDHETC